VLEPLDIFIKIKGGTYLWKGTAETFELPKTKVKQLAKNAPGEYLIFSQRTQGRQKRSSHSMQPSPERTFQCPQKFSQEELHQNARTEHQLFVGHSPFRHAVRPSIICGIEVEYVRAIGCIQDGGWGVHLESSGGKF
jgi:hypothetical protein